VERVANISLDHNTDYSTLNDMPLLWEYQAMDPSSAHARKGHKTHMYGRPDPSSYFRTTVTNVRPAAKQSRIINPWCKRILSVRELARTQGFPDSFSFSALDKNVRTMHRQIGNAVPWPLGEALGRELQLAVFEKWQLDGMEVV